MYLRSDSLTSILTSLSSVPTSSELQCTVLEPFGLPALLVNNYTYLSRFTVIMFIKKNLQVSTLKINKESYVQWLLFLTLQLKIE